MGTAATDRDSNTRACALIDEALTPRDRVRFVVPRAQYEPEALRKFPIALVFCLYKLLTYWCRGRESNPHDPFGSRDFKSRASANFATPASKRLVRPDCIGRFMAANRGLLCATGLDADPPSTLALGLNTLASIR